MFSTGLHLIVLWGIPVYPPAGISSVSPLNVRIEPAEDEPPSPQDAAATEAVEELTPHASVAVLKPRRVPSSASATKTEIEPAPRDFSSPSSGISVPAARDPIYYSARQLDVYPQPLSAINLPYPQSAVADRVDGRLLLSLTIDDFGIVNDVSVVESQPPGYFEEAARAVFLAMRFSPGMKDGRPVRTRVQIRIRYTYGESEAALR